MKRLAPSRIWTRAVAAVGLAVTLNAAAPVHAEVVAAPARTNGQTVPLPAPGTRRLIRIGPQALVVEDDHGRVKMVDEPGPAPKRARPLLGATATAFGILG